MISKLSVAFRHCIVFTVAMFGVILPVGAQTFPSKSEIVLIAADASEVSVGTVTFIPQSDGVVAIDVEVEADSFVDHFLSMRPFRCLEGASEWFCYQPYPYPIKNLITAGDLVDLEYQLLFIRKTPAEFGIDAWNGLYYKLELGENGVISGSLLEGDLNVLQSPPEQQYARPIDLFEFVEADSGRRLFPAIEIRPLPE